MTRNLRMLRRKRAGRVMHHHKALLGELHPIMVLEQVDIAAHQSLPRAQVPDLVGNRREFVIVADDVRGLSCTERTT